MKVHKIHNLLIINELRLQKYHFVVVEKMFDEIFDEVIFFFLQLGASTFELLKIKRKRDAFLAAKEFIRRMQCFTL